MTKIPLYDKISAELSYFKLGRNSMAYEYLTSAIEMVNRNSYYIRNFNMLYKDIAWKFETDTLNVRWSLSKLLSIMYLNTEDEIIQTYFNLKHYEKPSVKAFIMYVAKKIDYEDSLEEKMSV